jgi:hypothetical protein
MSDEIKLSCWVQGHRLDRGFLVRIKPSNTIADLKKAIQAEKPSFQQIEPDSLQLWKVGECCWIALAYISDPPTVTTVFGSIDDDYDYALRIKLENGQQLKWWKCISVYWKGEPADDTLSVILPRPAGSEYKWLVLSAVAILIDSS